MKCRIHLGASGWPPSGADLREFRIEPDRWVGIEGARDLVVRHRATRVVLPIEMPATSIQVVGQTAATEIEVQVFGRHPLSEAMRCAQRV